MKVGIVGSGQLARMLAQSVLDKDIIVEALGNSNDCAGDICSIVETNNLEDIKKWVQSVDVVTFENENVPSDILDIIFENGKAFPPRKALEIAQDRLFEKNMFNNLGYDTAPFYAVNTKQDLEEAIAKIGIPGILKTRRLGYDGKGQFKITCEDDIAKACEEMLPNDLGLIYEGFVDFNYEVSGVASVDVNNNIVVYPVVRNIHDKGILIKTIAPYNVPKNVNDKVNQIMKSVAFDLGYVGTFAIEFFVKQETVIVNEIAPRVHNSGHWSIDGANVSQFLNHMNGVCGFDVVKPTFVDTTMFNCIGKMPILSDFDKYDNIDGYNSYNKEERFGRKVGHVNIVNSKFTEKEIQEIEKICVSYLDY